MKSGCNHQYHSPAAILKLVVGCFLAVSAFAAAGALTPWSLSINTNNVVVVTNSPYSAVGDGVYTNTTAFQNAINNAATGGLTNGLRGGVVEVPAGTFLCGPLTDKSNVGLQLDAGAIVRLLPYTSYPGAPTSVAPFISGSSITNIAVTGPGIIDGQGSPWWPGYKTNSRPVILSLSSCSKVWLQGFTITNPPAAHIALKGANAGNIAIIGINLFAPPSEDPVNPSHNTDGVDFAETNALFQDCFISTGDDNIAVGSSASVSKDILVTNCFFGEGHGCSIGSFTSGGVSNLTVINCTFSNTDSGIRIKSQRDRGGVVQNLNYQNLTMTNVMTAASILSYYEFGEGTLDSLTPQYVANFAATSTNPVPYEPPNFRYITFSNITASVANAGQMPLFLIGLPDVPINNIVFDKVSITSKSTQYVQIYNVTNLQFIDCSWALPAGGRMQFWDAGVTYSNTVQNPTPLPLDGLTTNGLGNNFQFFNAAAAIANTNAITGGMMTFSGSTLTVSNNLLLLPSTIYNFTLGTNTAKAAIVGNLSLGGTNNIFAGGGFTNGSYTLFSYTGTLNGSLPVLGSVPAGYNYSFNTLVANQVNLVVTLLPPANLIAMPANLAINLQWDPVSGANSYNVKRGNSSGGPYSMIFNTITGTNFIDGNVTNGVNYFYVVSAVGAGGESTNSTPVVAVPLPSNRPTNIVLQASGGQLQLSWPQDHMGWRLQVQTNNSTSGIGTNWVDVPGATNLTSTNVATSQSSGSTFFRLVYP